MPGSIASRRDEVRRDSRSRCRAVSQVVRSAAPPPTTKTPYEHISSKPTEVHMATAKAISTAVAARAASFAAMPRAEADCQEGFRRGRDRSERGHRPIHGLRGERAGVVGLIYSAAAD